MHVTVYDPYVTPEQAETLGVALTSDMKAALVDKALRDRSIRSAALDVLAQEPPAPDHPLLSNLHITISPHSAGLTERMCSAHGDCVCTECSRLF